MTRGRQAVVLLVVMMVMVAVQQRGEAAISCGTVSSKLAPCVSYVTGTGTTPSGGCCSGVQSLYALTKGLKADRVTACNCIKSLAKALGNKLNTGRASGVPGQCGVNLGYSINLSTNCAAIP